MSNNSPSSKIRAFSPGTEDPGLDNDPVLHLTRVFVYFLQNLFRDYPEGCGMRWRPDEENTEIVITAEKPTQEAIKRKPHITCVLGASRWAGVSLDQLVHSRASDGRRIHTDLMPCTMAYHCMAREGLQARRIAWNASFYTNVLRRVIIRAGGLHQVGMTHDISAESSAAAYTGPTTEDEIVGVVVNVPFYWQPQWRITKPATVWRQMRMTMNVNAQQPFYSAGRASVRSVTVQGVPVQTVPLDPKPPGIVQEVRATKFVGEE